MKTVLLALAGLFLWNCGSMDGFLFNSKKQDKYELPGKTIADSLITPVTFESGGNTLYGFWVEPAAGRAPITFLYCHGNKHGIDEYWERVELLHKLGVNVFIFDYRGYGRSEGESSEKGLHEDGEAAYQYIKMTYNVADSNLCLYGYSLGNVVSIYLASGPAFGARRLFSECPFASANSLTQAAIGLDIPPLWLTDGEYNNAENIKKTGPDLLLMHGEKDDFVRYRDNGLVVYNNAPGPNKELHPVKEAVHTDVPDVLGEAVYLQLLQDWIGKPF